MLTDTRREACSGERRKRAASKGGERARQRERRVRAAKESGEKGRPEIGGEKQLPKRAARKLRKKDSQK
jgi:hypothetical protein